MFGLALPDHLDLRRRAASAALALAAAGLMLLALIGLGVVPAPLREPADEPNSFALSPDAEAGPEAVAEKAERRAEAARPPARETAARPEPETPPPAPVPPPPVREAVPGPDMLILDADQFARSDIGARRSGGAGREGAAAGADSAAAYGPGEGPGGQRLYEAEWHREPSRAELAGYLPPGGAPPGAYALIACRTVERFEVDNCRSLGEFPLGSGLARAMRQAAWQFRVRPPRIGGRALVGAWVRIRITFSEAP